MARIKNTTVVSRPSTDVDFNDVASLNDYLTEYNRFPIDFTVSFSEDFLTRTRVEIYDESLDTEIHALYGKYSGVLAAESARKQTAGIQIVSHTTEVV